MTDNFINIYVNNKRMQTSGINGSRPQDYSLYSRGKKGVKPASPRGYLVQENIISGAVSNVKAYGDSAKYLYDAAIKGEGNDYSVGRINDLTLRMGSLGIAVALAASKVTPVGKGMEFVGLASWFAGMALWPQIIGAPIKWAKGFDINQEYVNSKGDRKKFFIDPQYLPWDLYSDEQIYKIGDKLGVPKDIKDRKTAIQDKMKQIAIQGNTLAMITAGIATPVLASIIADRAQKYVVTPAVEAYRISSAERNLDSFDKKIGKLLEAVNNNSQAPEAYRQGTEALNRQFEELFRLDKKALGKLNAILGAGEEKALTRAELTQLEKFFEARHNGSGAYKGIQDILKEIGDETQLDIDSLRKGLQQQFKLSDDQLNDIFKPGQDGTIKKNSIIRKTKSLITAQLAPDGNITPAIKNSLDEQQKVINGMLEQNTRYRVDSGRIRRVFSLTEGFVSLRSQVERFETATIRNISDSLTANQWREVPVKYLQSLGLSQKQIRQLAAGSINASETLTRHFEQMSPEQATKALKKMSRISDKAIKREEKALARMLGSLLKVKEATSAIARINNLENLAGEFERNLNLYAERTGNKILDTVSSFTRPIKALDIFTRDLATDVSQLLKGKNYDITQNSGLAFGKVVDNIVAYVKDIAIHRNDVDNWTNKMETTFREIPHGVRENGLLADIAELVFGKLSPAAEKSIENPAMVQKINSHNELMKKTMLAINNPIQPHMNRQDLGEFSRPFKSLATISGKDVADFFVDAAQDMLCKNKWWKFTAILGGTTAALSALAIFSFGRKNSVNPDVYEKKGGKA